MYRVFCQSIPRLNQFYAKQAFSTTSSPPNVVSLEPGLALIKGALAPQEQQQLSKDILALGSHQKTGFWNLSANNNPTLNSRPYRGRMFGALSTYPPILTSLAKKNLELVSQIDKTIKPIVPTHSILLYYKSLLTPPKQGFIPWHQDNGQNDGDEDFPIVSFSLGDTCEFLIAHSKPQISPEHPIDDPINLAHRLMFESGDIIVFGGPSRKIWHSIYKIHPDSTPSFLPFDGARLNATLRHTPRLLGQEEHFATQDAEKLSKSNQFYNTLTMK